MSSTIKTTFKLFKGKDILFVGNYSEFKNLLKYHFGIKSKLNLNILVLKNI